MSVSHDGQKLEVLRQERDRLRDALEGLLTHVGVFSSDSDDGDRARAKAIEALELADGREKT